MEGNMVQRIPFHRVPREVLQGSRTMKTKNHTFKSWTEVPPRWIIWWFLGRNEDRAWVPCVIMPCQELSGGLYMVVWMRSL